MKFGNPDGSRADIKEIKEDFIAFDTYVFGEGLGIKENDLSVRVIAGAKGSGKTVYLRRLHAAATDNESIYTDKIRYDIPSTSNIVKFCQCYADEFLTEKWMQLWYCAILRSLVSHILKKQELFVRVEKEKFDLLERYQSDLFPQYKTSVSVYSQVTSIINEFNTAHQYNRYFDHPSWAELEEVLADILPCLPPIYFFMDAVDEEYSHAPMYWLRCQKGLFYRVMRFLRDPVFGGRFHVIVCIRDHVLASVYRSEHQNRYRGEPHIRVLDWNCEAIGYFLDKKLSKLADEYFITNVNGNIFRKWTGHSKIQNVSREIQEDIDSYLLRHTRMLPRDVILLGNIICDQVSRYKKKGYKQLPQDVIRHCVSTAARQFGNEQIAICANQIVSSNIPKEAGRKGFTEIYTGDSEYVRGFDDKLKNIIKAIGKDRFSHYELVETEKLAKQQFGATSDVFSVLWHNRLLGYREMGPDGWQEIFFSSKHLDEFNLPRPEFEYFFHSCLIDSVGIASVGAEPIRETNLL